MFSLPNLLTLSRIAAIPLVVACFWLDHGWAQWVQRPWKTSNRWPEYPMRWRGRFMTTFVAFANALVASWASK